MSIGFAEEAVEQAAGVVTQTTAATEAPPLVNAILGYLVVFIGLILLMIVVILVGKIFTSKKSTPAEENTVPAAPTDAAPKKLAPGSAGDVKIYDTDPRDAAMIMAIVADKLGKPLNELRFRSIKEVK